MATIGIDLGTTNSLAAVWKDNTCQLIPNAYNEFLTPSVISVDDNGEILVGKAAKERLISHPLSSASNFKQFMGTDKEYILDKRKFRPEDLSSFILRQLREDAEAYLGESVTEAVISTPAYFNDQQRASTKNAGKLAGLKVDRIVNEPSAAALAYQHDTDSDGIYLVIDFGGGTLDVTVVEMFANIVDIVSIAGDNRLGGSDIDNTILEAFLNKHSSLSKNLSKNERASILKAAEQCKMSLTDSKQEIMVYQKNDHSYTMSLNNQILSDICEPLLNRIRTVLHRALKDAGYSISQLTDIILVGGSCRMPLVKQYIRFITQREPLEDIDPSQAVAQGAGMVTGIILRDDEIKDMVLTDVCPFTLGIKTTPLDGSAFFSPIIERNSALPVSAEEEYTTVHDGQKSIIIEIYQGDSMNVEKNLFLDKLAIQIPARPAGEVIVYVRFTYDINGILLVDVRCPMNGNSVHTSIVSNKSLSENEINDKLKRLEAFKIAPRDKAENRLLIATGERLYEEHSGWLRERIKYVLAQFMYELKNGGNPARIEKMRAEISDFFTRIDNFDDGLIDTYNSWEEIE